MNADGSGETAITSGGEHKLFGWGLHDLPDVAKPTVSGMHPKPGSKIVATDDARNVGTKSWSFTVQ